MCLSCFLLDHGGSRGRIKVLEWLPPFEALRHANAGCANDVWTEEDEWEGSLRGI